MTSRSDVLREVMRDTRTTQSALSRLSGVHQPSISGFLSGRVDLSDEMLDRLLSCMGYRLEVVRRPVRPHLTRSVERSWRLHRQLSTHLSRARRLNAQFVECMLVDTEDAPQTVITSRDPHGMEVGTEACAFPPRAGDVH